MSFVQIYLVSILGSELEKTGHLTFAISSLNIDRFSQFFRWHTPWKILHRNIVKDPTTP